MMVRILGCSGGVGGADLQTTSILLGDTALIDAGTGVVSLPLERLSAINSLFVTHAHLDHIAIAPMLIDSTSDSRAEPLVIHALPPTIESMRKHIFNWEIWPDFSQIEINGMYPQAFHSINVGDQFELPEGSVVVGPALHQVPACSYLIIGKRHKIFFSGDTTYTPEIVTFLKKHAPVEHIILECAFGQKEQKIAEASSHMYSKQVVQLMDEINMPAQFYITHLKPSQRDVIMSEIINCDRPHRVSRLYSQQTFNI